ncbi:hypothetical protein Q7C36_017033 [Tachysurus vachellii]|uniref:Uncharacterized protein n=1 Tax=Tachysurus vachellii TaxID=175792 RepID=A0AA88S6Y7_TACVA|nr:hypothetical protein Q7C36_017033 [Tachysurus vachellii]
MGAQKCATAETLGSMTAPGTTGGPVLKSATTYQSRPIRFLPAVLIEGARCFLINYGDVEETSSPKRLGEREPSPERNARGWTNRV